MLTRRSRSNRSSTRAGAFRGGSRHLLSLSSVGAFLALFAQGLTSCGSDEGGAACEPNVLRACAGPGSCEGTQTCASDGSGYSECSCGGGSAGSAGAGGSGGGGSAGGAAGAGGNAPLDPLFDLGNRAVGAPCTSDAECPVGPDGEAPLTCISATTPDVFGAGGPQDGYCTARCRANTDCQALDAFSACTRRDEEGNGYCVGVCEAGANGIKCSADRAQACQPPPAGSTNNIGVCIPVCQSDAACGEGLFCNLDVIGTAVCSSTEPVGGDIGAACTEATSATDCKSGLCLTLDSDPPVSFCSSICTFGLPTESCGFTPASGVPQEAYCAQPTSPSGVEGDLGICVELCDEAADCEQAGWECADLTPAGQELLGRFGECVPPGTLATLPDAGAP